MESISITSMYINVVRIIGDWKTYLRVWDCLFLEKPELLSFDSHQLPIALHQSLDIVKFIPFAVA